MMNKIEGYRYELNWEMTNSEIKAQGEVWGEMRHFRLTPGAIVKTKFRTHDVKGKIAKLNKVNALIELENGKVKAVAFKELIQQNMYIETTLRFENNSGFGPYQSDNASPELLAWRQVKSAQYREEHMNDRLKHPSPHSDDRLSTYPLLQVKALFGFRDIKQLNEWFSKEDQDFLLTQGFKIVVKQKGLDYFESIYSHAQIAIIMTEADYKYISENQTYNYR